MPIRKTPLITENFYHVFNRGVNKQSIFTDKADYRRMLNVINYYKHTNHSPKFSTFIHLPILFRNEALTRIENSNSYVDILSYCLMPTHFHLLIKQNLENGTSKFLSNIQNSYTRYFNLRHDRSGHLFQGQFKSVLVQLDEQLIHVSRYIHLNPYSSAIVNDLYNLDNYEWSSLHEYINFANPSICNKRLIINDILFKNSQDYLKFVHDNADYQKRLEDIKHLLFE